MKRQAGQPDRECASQLAEWLSVPIPKIFEIAEMRNCTFAVGSLKCIFIMGMLNRCHLLSCTLISNSQQEDPQVRPQRGGDDERLSHRAVMAVAHARERPMPEAVTAFSSSIGSSNQPGEQDMQQITTDRVTPAPPRARSHPVMRAKEPREDPDVSDERLIQEGGLKCSGQQARGDNGDVEVGEDSEDGEEEECCMICLGSPMKDRTVLPNCGHSNFCFGCIYRWSHQSRKCPLCVRDFTHLVHDIHSDRDFSRFFLRPLDATAPAPPPYASPSTSARDNGRRNYVRRGGASAFDSLRQGEGEQADEPDIQFRRAVYRRSAYALHVGSNKFTGFTPPPTPIEFQTSAGLRARARGFVLRELGVWRHVSDMPDQRRWVTSYLVEMAQYIHLGSDAAVQLWSDLCSVPPPVAQHFLHELQHFLRSPFKTVQMWDRHVRYPIDVAS